MADMIDDTDDNISERTPYYSEMTAQYWARKNVHDVEYIGFYHYRRYFGEAVTKDNVDTFFADGTDLILAGPEFRLHNRWNCLKTFVCSKIRGSYRYLLRFSLPVREYIVKVKL